MIADCETCDRKQVPCRSCQESQRAICYRCDGDVDDPYCEAEEPAILICDGSKFTASTYPPLRTMLGGTDLPDVRDRNHLDPPRVEALK